MASNHQQRSSPDLAAPRVAPRVRKSPKKHNNNNNNTLKEEGSVLQDKDISNKDSSVLVNNNNNNQDERSSPPNTDLSLVDSQVDRSILTTWEQIDASSQDIKTRMLLAANHAALRKAEEEELRKAEEITRKAEEAKKQNEQCGSIEVIGEMYDAGWLAPCGVPCLQDNVVVSLDSWRIDPKANKSQRSRCLWKVAKDESVDKQTKPQVHYFTNELSEEVLTVRSSASNESVDDKYQQAKYHANELSEEVLTVTSSCSCSSGGDLNSYPSCDKSAAETAATLQTVHEDDDVIPQLQKVVPLWKRLFHSSKTTTVADDPSHVSVHMTCDSIEASLDDDLTANLVTPEKQENIHVEMVLPDDHETGVEAILTSENKPTQTV